MTLYEKLILDLFEIRNYKIIDSKATKSIQLDLERTSKSVCPICRKECPKYDSSSQRFYIGNLNGKVVYADVKIYRIMCEEHGVITEHHGITKGKRKYTETVAKNIINYTEVLDNTSVAKLLGLSPSTVYRIDREKLLEMFLKYKTNIPKTTKICVDETAYRKRHNYVTIICDYNTSKVLWVEKDRTKYSLIQGYKAISSTLSNIECVSMDLWSPYDTITQKTIPKAKIIYDKFHLTRILNRYIEDQRREYQKELTKEEIKEMKKNYRWILLKRKDNHSFTNSLDLEELKKKTQKLYELYLLKESFLAIFDEPNKTRKEASRMIFSWIKEVNKTDLTYLKKFAKATLKRLRKMLNWFDCPISNGKAEGINNTIKTLFKRAYGYKDFEYMRLKILQKSGMLMNYV